MKKPLTDEDLQERAGIDGRVTFAVAVFLGAAGLVALLDRIGVPERFVEVLGPAVALVGLATIGILLRTMRISRFYAGGRAMPAAYAGLAMASLGTALFLPFLPPFAGAISLPGLLSGMAGGIVIAAMLTGPLLRKTGAFSVPDLIASRFPNVALRLGVVTVVSASGFLVALAGFGMAVESLTSIGASHGLGVWLVGIALAVIAAPGGLAGVGWAAAGAAGILAAGLGLPLVMLVVRGDSLPLPVAGEARQWEAAIARILEWQGTQDHAAGAVIVAAIMLGLGVLAPLLAPAIATAGRASAQRTGAAALAWIATLAVIIAATLAISALAFDRRVAGARPADLPQSILAASAAGGVRICGGHPGAPAAVAAACGAQPGFQGVLRKSDAAASGSFLVRALPDLTGLGRAFSGLATAGLLAVALVLAAAGFHTAATALGHDAFYRVSDVSAMTSRRLAVTRMLAVGAIVLAGFVLSQGTPDPRTLIGLAIALCAASIAPLLLLSLWPRAESSDATIALLAGLAAAETILFFGGTAPTIEIFARAAVFAAFVSLTAGLATSLLRRADPTGHGAAFVHGVLHGDNEVLHPDKGA